MEDSSSGQRTKLTDDPYEEVSFWWDYKYF